MIDPVFRLMLRRHWCAIDSDSATAFPFGDLSGGASHTAGCSDDERRFSGLEMRGFDQADPCGHKIRTDGSSFFERQALRLRADAVCRHDQQLRISAVTSESDVAASAPYFGADHLARTVDDDSREVASGRARQRCALHAAEDIFCVA